MKGLARSCVLKYVTLKANPDHLSSNVEYVHQSRSFAMVGLYTPDSLAVFATLPNFRVKQATFEFGEKLWLAQGYKLF